MFVTPLHRSPFNRDRVKRRREIEEEDGGMDEMRDDDDRGEEDAMPHAQGAMGNNRPRGVPAKQRHMLLGGMPCKATAQAGHSPALHVCSQACLPACLLNKQCSSLCLSPLQRPKPFFCLPPNATPHAMPCHAASHAARLQSQACPLLPACRRCRSFSSLSGPGPERLE